MAIFDLFSKGKRNVRCARCNAPISGSEGKEINGSAYCSACYQRIKAAGGAPKATATASRKPEPVAPARKPEPKARDFSDKYGRGGGPAPVAPKPAPKPASKPASGHGASGGSMPAPLREVKQVLDSSSTKYQENHHGDQWEIATGISGDHNYLIKFICKERDTDSVAIRVFGLFSAHRSQYPKIYPVLNELQQTYRFLRFTLDADGDINAEYDIQGLTDDAGMVALEMILRISKILDDAYPKLRQAVYG